MSSNDGIATVHQMVPAFIHHKMNLMSNVIKVFKWWYCNSSSKGRSVNSSQNEPNQLCDKGSNDALVIVCQMTPMQFFHQMTLMQKFHYETTLT